MQQVTADPRHQARRLALLKLYAELYGDQIDLPEEVVTEMPQTTRADLTLLQMLVNGVKSRLADIDKLVAECAPEWPLDRIAKIDLAILRISVYELMNTDLNQSVVIDEAVELAKEFGGDTSSKFVNGVLGTAAERFAPKQ